MQFEISVADIEELRSGFWEWVEDYKR